MTLETRPKHPRPARRGASAAIALAAAALAGCGGGGSNPFDNPSNVNNLTTNGGQTLAFAYFQKCIQPILTTRSCAASGCHDNITGTGGALRLIGGAAPIDLSIAANTPEVIRTNDMYKNFYSAQGSSIIGSAAQSKLLLKPLVQRVLHGGGLIFSDSQDPNVKLMEYWINRPLPLGQNEFSSASYSMFTPAFDPANPAASACNTQ